MNREFREYTGEDIMNATRKSPLRVDVARDAYPGGLRCAACRRPCTGWHTTRR